MKDSSLKIVIILLSVRISVINLVTIALSGYRKVKQQRIKT